MDFVWVEQTSLARFIALTPGVYPVLSALHILGIALLFGAIVPVDLAIIGVLRGAIRDAADDLISFAVTGFSLAAITGALLATVQLSRYVEKDIFLIKLGLILTAGVNALIFKTMRSRSLRRVTAGMSLALWVLVIFAGRWIAFS